MESSKTSLSGLGMGSRVHACEKCTRKCLLKHGNETHCGNTLSFFKVMIGSFSRYLFLPPKIAFEALTLVDQRTVLEDMNGRRWSVMLSIINGSLAFQEGWSKFVSDHCIEFGEFLVFDYIIGSHFIVQIFGKSGCEKLKFSARNHSNYSEVGQTQRVEHRVGLPSDDRFSDTMEGQCYMDNEGAMKEVSAGTRATCCSSSDFEMDESKCNVEEGGKTSTTLEKSPESPVTMHEGAMTSTALPNFSDLEMVNIKSDTEATNKIPKSTEKSSECGSHNKRTDDTLEAPYNSIDKNMNGRGEERNKRACSILPHFERTPRKCGVEMEEVPVADERFSNENDLSRMTSKSSIREDGAARSQSVISKGIYGTPEMCYMIDGDSANEMCQNTCPGLSYCEMTNKCCAEDVSNVHIPTGKTSKCKLSSKTMLDEVPVSEKTDCRNLSHYEMNRSSKSDMEDVDKVPTEGKINSCLQDGFKMTCDFSQRPCCVTDANLYDRVKARRSQVVPFGLSDVEMMEMKCNAEYMGTASTTDKTSHYKSGFRGTFDASEGSCLLIDNDLVNGERPTRTGLAVTGSSDVEVVESKHGAYEMDYVRASTGKSSTCASRFKRTSDALGVPCDIIDDYLMNGEGAARRGSPNLFDLKLVGGRCNVEDIDQKPRTRIESSSFQVNSERPTIAAEIDEKGNPNVSDADRYKFPHSDECKCASSGKERCSVLETDLDVDSCLKDELKAVKVEKSEGSSSIGFSPIVVTFSSQSWLELPTELLLTFDGIKKSDRMVIFLLDPDDRVWPVLYHQKSGYRCLGSGWKDFAVANNLQHGDACMFEVVNKPDATLRVGIFKGGCAGLQLA